MSAGCGTERILHLYVSNIYKHQKIQGVISLRIGIGRITAIRKELKATTDKVVIGSPISGESVSA